MMNPNWFSPSDYTCDEYDDWDCIIYPHDEEDFLKAWEPLLQDDFSRFIFKAYCTHYMEDEEQEELAEQGILYDCYVWLEDYDYLQAYTLAHFHAHDLDEALNMLCIAGNAIDF